MISIARSQRRMCVFAGAVAASLAAACSSFSLSVTNSRLESPPALPAPTTQSPPLSSGTPSLYETYAAAQLRQVLGQPIHVPAGATAWLQSLQQTDGCFANPRNGIVETLGDTHRAVAALKALGAAPRDPDATVACLQSFQSQDGLYRWQRTDEVPEAGPDGMYDAIQTLRLIDRPASRAALAVLRGRIYGYVTQIDSTTPPYVLVAGIHELASAGSLAVPPNARTFVAHYLNDVLAQRVQPASELDFEILVETADRMGLLRAAEREQSVALVRKWVTDSVVSGGVGLPSEHISLMRLYRHVALARAFNLPVDQSAVANVVNARLGADGWMLTSAEVLRYPTLRAATP